MSSKTKARQQRTMIYVLGATVIGLLLLLGVYYAYQSGVLGPAEEEEAEVSAETVATFEVYDFARSTTSLTHWADVEDNGEVDPDIDIWELDISDMEFDEIEEITFADFSLKDSGEAENEELEPEDDYIYLVNISVPGSNEVWLHYSDGTPLITEMMDSIIMGVNRIYLLNQTSDANMQAYNSTLGSTIADNTDDDYNILINFDSNYEGCTPDYDVDNDRWDYFCIIVEFNQTASSSWVTVPSNEANQPLEKLASVNKTYLFFGGFLYGKSTPEEISIHLTGVPETDYSLVSMSIGYGSPDAVGSITTYDTQT